MGTCTRSTSRWAGPTSCSATPPTSSPTQGTTSSPISSATEVVGRNVLEGRWTYQIVEEFDDGYYDAVRQAEQRVLDELLDGKRHVFEAEMKERRRTPRPPPPRAPSGRSLLTNTIGIRILMVWTMRLTRAEQGEQTRAELLAAAREEFLDAGYHGATLDRIAAAAGYTKGAVYSRYASKADLFLDLLEAAHRRPGRRQRAAGRRPRRGRRPDRAARALAGDRPGGPGVDAPRHGVPHPRRP